MAVAFAVIAFLGLFYSLMYGSNFLANNSDNFLAWQPWLVLAAYALYMLSGAVASALSKERVVVSGVVAGFVSALSAVVLFGVGGGMVGVVLTVVCSVLLGGLGGWLSALLKRRAANAL